MTAPSRALRFVLSGLLATTISAYSAVLVRDQDAPGDAGETAVASEAFVSFPKLSATNALAKTIKSMDVAKPVEDLLAEAQAKLATDPMNPRILTRLGELYLRSSRLDEAADCFWKAARLAPDNVNALENLAFSLLASGDHRNGYEIYEQLVDLQPNNPRIKFNLAAALYNLGRHKEASNILAEFLSLYPQNSRALYNMGAIQFALKKYKEAAGYFEKSRELQPDSVYTIVGLARAYQVQGMTGEYNALRKNALTAIRESDFNAVLGQSSVPAVLLR